MGLEYADNTCGWKADSSFGEQRPIIMITLDHLWFFRSTAMSRRRPFFVGTAVVVALALASVMESRAYGQGTSTGSRTGTGSGGASSGSSASSVGGGFTGGGAAAGGGFT